MSWQVVSLWTHIGGDLPSRDRVSPSLLDNLFDRPGMRRQVSHAIGRSHRRDLRQTSHDNRADNASRRTMDPDRRVESLVHTPFSLPPLRVRRDTEKMLVAQGLRGV